MLSSHHPFCTAEPNESELVVLMVQKKHIYKLIVSPVYSSNRTVNNLTGKKSKIQMQSALLKKSKTGLLLSQRLAKPKLLCTILETNSEGMN